jgi:hypothetical protein
VNELKLLTQLRPLINEWPCGVVVWHRASGRRGVIAGYRIYSDCSVNLMVDYGDGNYSSDMPTSLSSTKVSDGTDGDEWKDGKDHV